ncbi:MAG: aminotransferase class V-fold PLP-dependent enzyme, partial [Burkholderiales bacterium]
IEQREDAGTPGTVQRIRAALAFLVKQSVGAHAIEQLEDALIQDAIARLRRHPRVELLGSLDAPRLAILSFLVRTESGRYLHPRLVVRLLNDLFGIQSRGGCACAGPYAHRLLKIDPPRAEAFRDAVLGGFDAVKPGWTRLNFSYFIEADEFEFLIDAIEFIADHGERFLGQYVCDWQAGAWRHPLDQAQPDLLALAARPAMRFAAPLPGFAECMAQAHAALSHMPTPAARPRRGLPQDLPVELVTFGY